MSKIKVYLNKDILNKDKLREHFDLIENPLEADYCIYWVDLPHIGVKWDKCIYISYEVPLTGPIYYAYSNFDKFHSVYCYNPNPSKSNQFPITNNSLYYPVSSYFGIDVRRDKDILKTRGVFYCGQKAGEMYKDVPDTFGLNLKMARDTLCIDLMNKYKNTYVAGPGWQKDTKGDSFRKNKIDDIQRENSDFHLVIENYSMPNLVSERLQDGFSSDRLIFYFGAPNIREIIPENCFVDLTPYFNFETKRFDTDRLIRFMNDITLEGYMEMLNNAREFKASMDRKGFDKARDDITERIIERIEGKKSFVSEHFNKEKIEELCETIRPNWNTLDLNKDALNHLSLIKVPQGANRICEIGCGCGRLLKVLKEQGKQVSGIDASEKMVEYSKTFTPNTDITLCSGNGEINKPNNSFDFVYSMITFQHIPSLLTIKKYINEAYRILDKGQFMFQTLKWDGMEQSSDLRNFHNIDELIKYMEDIGFKNITKEEVSSWVIIRGDKI